MDFQATLAQAQADVQACLDAVMAGLGQDRVAQAMRYTTRGGKRLRAVLALETAALFDVPRDRALRAGAAVECLHAYSLVHDDLPCMDDDALRRGQPTVHVKWDEATAVLTGDALQTLAFEILADPATDPDPAVRTDLVLRLARASGARGMVLGQAQDIAAETATTPLDLDAITTLQQNKTGKLLVWPCEAGAILGRADPAPLRQYARALGLAFQIADDILDIEGDAAIAGKALQKDAAAGKATFVSLLGLDAAKARANALIAEAHNALTPYGPRADTLRAIAHYVVTRDK